MAGTYLRGAIIQYMETFLVPLPNIIIFQYNPESIVHSWTVAEQVTDDEGQTVNPLAVKGMPGESFSLTILVDANDTIAEGNPVSKGLAEVSGVYSRLAALEMLLFPSESPAAGLAGSVSAAAGSVGGAIGGGAAATSVPAMEAPVALFVWGAGRIVPIRVTGLTITEKIYDRFLNPTHAEIKLDLRVLTPEEIAALPAGAVKEIANVAYKYSHGLRQVLAIGNLANAADGVIGMLPV